MVTPPDLQEWDLRTHFGRTEVPVADIASRWLEVEHFRCLVPMGVAAPVRDLFLSNIRATLIRLVREQTALAATA